ncbi:hypothetical protein F4818DRAFT_397486 [Hypoxylon cercidicola]|nr:hypothetical protein F4818DRAFT_397486 [Hypoxylon cercidicola]
MASMTGHTPHILGQLNRSGRQPCKKISAFTFAYLENNVSRRLASNVYRQAKSLEFPFSTPRDDTIWASLELKPQATEFTSLAATVMHDDPSPPSSTSLSPESLSDDDNYYTASENHEEPGPLLSGQSEGEIEVTLAEENEIQDSVIIHAREYQLEMFQESLKRNIIVAMETGTGKTQVAVLRIQAELGKCGADKIIWFLAPTVALCEQQFRVLKSQIRAVQIKILIGEDGIQTWSDVRTWDEYLKNVRVVVSTYQILLEAITHAFVRMDRLSLIVFDEAHNCRGKHPGSLIMDRYRNNKTAGLPVPSILGLTASPVISSKLDTLEDIERTLDAVCKGPTIHREELRSIAQRPNMHCVSYSLPSGIPITSTMESLSMVYINLNIYEDPYIIRRQADSSERSRIELLNALNKRSTYVRQQFQSLWRRSGEIQQELGSWAADYYISVAIAQFLESVQENNQWFREWAFEEKRYLANELRKVQISTPPPFESATGTEISDKVTVLVRELLRSLDDTIGIIFVREVSTVAVLSHILSIHPLTKDRFRIGTMVGTSNYAGKKRDLGALAKVNSSQDLEDFRNGEVNLLLGTSVLEEGIDVPACNMVICFDKPDNLKAFIQRRGRARMRESKLILLMSDESPAGQINEWTALEEEMKRRYEDEMRQLLELEESEESDVEPLYIPETGAKLDFDQAKSHLEHFCRKLSVRQYADLRPYYIFKKTDVPGRGVPQISATVVLPMSLPPDLRRVESSGVWSSEKNASKDAAFQAYVAIYKAGLLNDNLLPLKDEFLQEAQSRVGEAEVRERWSPWIRVAHAWGRQLELYQRPIRLTDRQGDVLCEFEASLPVPFPELAGFELFWDASTSWRVEVGEMKVIPTHDIQIDQSPTLVDLAWRHRLVKAKDEERFILHLQSPTRDILSQQYVGQKTIDEACLGNSGLVRNNQGYPFFFKAYLPSLHPPLKATEMLADEPVDVPWLVLEKWPRRRDFLHPLKDTSLKDACRKPKLSNWPAHLCQMDNIHVSNVYFGAFIPAIIHMIDIHLVVHELCNTLLKDVGFSNIPLVLTAISSPAAEEATNYQRLEFLGDSILKTYTAATVTANFPHYPEGYLDAIKTNIVSNSRLYRAAIETGLDRFILKDKFTATKWKPLYVEHFLKAGADEEKKRKMGTKTLADVVEALIGAAYLDGGMPKALSCIRIFLPEVDWRSFDSACSALFSQTPMSTQLPAALVPLEELIGYSFRNKNLLVEAATHSSFGLVNAAGSCMERLEFLGDAVLDSVIVSVIWEHNLEPRDMHLLRTASVNADLLGFLGMEWTISQAATSVSKDGTTTETRTHTPFWKFMRHVSPDMGIAQRAAEERHALERDGILEAIRHAKTYPWAQLGHLHIPKFFSDFFESVLGAVWVDSGASMEACAGVAEKAGILPCLRRIVADGVDVLHPKNHLGILAGKSLKAVEYRTEVRDVAAAHGSRELFCRILVAGEVIVEVGGGVSYEEVQTKAADMAYKILRDMEGCSRGEGEGEDDVMME